MRESREGASSACSSERDVSSDLALGVANKSGELIVGVGNFGTYHLVRASPPVLKRGPFIMLKMGKGLIIGIVQ